MSSYNKINLPQIYSKKDSSKTHIGGLKVGMFGDNGEE